MANIALKDQSFNRRTYDGCKTNDDLRLTTGPGRYQLDAPPQYCDATYAPEPTTILQKWGDSQNAAFIKTDVESDLFNINRPTTKTICNQYDPAGNKMNNTPLTNMKEQSFPQTHTRLNDPPCTLRSSGWNRWEWLCQNPQEKAMMPFDYEISTRLQQKDEFRPCIPTPTGSREVLPAPNAYEPETGFQGLEQDALNEYRAAVNRSVNKLPRGVDVLPAPPNALYGIQPSPLNPPSTGYARHGYAQLA
jgi:hypothetical protein